MRNTIVIPTYNRSQFLHRSLQALSCQPGLNMKTVIVVDDCSTAKHATHNRVLCNQFGATYLLQSRNRGAASSRNTGAGHTKSEWVTFVDDDVRVQSQWYEQLCRHIESAPAHVMGLEGKTLSEGDGLWDAEVRNISGGSFITANIAYRRSVLQKSGLFDDRLATSGEDCDLALRIQRYGTIRFVPTMCVIHSPREIKLLHYLFSSGKRMRLLLNYELLLYMKNRDRYHTCRYRNSFWATYFDIISKHILITFRRREIKRIVRNPIPAFFLFLSTLIEQLYALFLFPTMLEKFLSDDPFADPAIDRDGTAAINQVSINMLDRFRLRPRIGNALLFKRKRRPVYSLNMAVLCGNDEARRPPIKAGDVSRPTPVFIRFDDVFFDNEEKLKRFGDFIAEQPFAFLAGITANDLSSRANWPRIKQLQRRGAQIALHGFNHTGKFGAFPSELLQMNFLELEARLDRTISKVPKQLHPMAFIPPFNTLSREQVLFLTHRFRLICGGPETVRFTWRLGCPVALKGGGVYLPSLYPFYQSAAKMLETNTLHTLSRIRFPVCITFHMPQEADDNFRSVSTIVKHVRERIVSRQVLWN